MAGQSAGAHNKKARRKTPATRRSREAPARRGVDHAGAEQALRESEERFRATFEQAAVGVAHTTTDGRFLQVNSKLCQIVGYTSGELLGLTTRDLTHPDDRDRQDELRRELLAGQRASFAAEKRYRRKDGSDIWVNRTVTLARSPTTGTPYLIQVIEDISERKHTEARLGRLMRARRVMVECSHIVAHATDETAMLESMCRVVVESGGYKMAWVGLATDDPARPVYAAAHAGFAGDTPMTGSEGWSAEGRYQGFLSEVMATGEPHIARDILHDPAHARRRARALQRGFQSSIALPLKGDGRPLGAIALYAVEPDAFDSEEIALLRGLADDIAFGVASLRERVARRNAESAQRESEQRFRETFEQAAVGITRVDLNGVLVDFNQKFCDMLGYGRDELLGKHIRDITHPDDFGTGSTYRVQLAHRTMQSASGEKRFIRKDGTVMWARRTMSTACDPTGEPLYVISVVEDITERKELEHHFELTFNQAAVGMTQTGLDGRLLQVNQKYADMLGYRREELYSMRIDDLTHPEDRAEIVQMRRKLLNREIDSASSEKRLVRKDGRVIWVDRTFSLVRNASGEPLHYMAVVEDITARKEADERYRTTFDSAPVGIMHTALDDDRVLRANSKLCEMVGYTHDELLGMTTDDFVHPDYASADRGKYRERMLRGELSTFSSERRYRRKDGSDLWVNRTVSLARDAGGRPAYFIRIIEDVTERVHSVRRRAIEHAVTQVLAEAATMDDAMPRVLETICRALEWTCGAYWKWDEAAQLLHCAETWHVNAEGVAEFIAATRGSPNEAPAWRGAAPGVASGGVVRRVWFSGAPAWFPDVMQYPDFRRGPMAAKAGLHSAFGFPVLAGTQPLGVVEFYSREINQPDEALLQMVRAIGSQIGQFIQRKRAEAALRESEEQFKQLAGNIPQVFWIGDAAQKHTLYVSPAAEALIGRPLREIQDNPRTLVRAVHEEDRARVLAARKTAAAGDYDLTYRVVRPDGSIRWVHDRAFPVRDESGKVYRIAGIAEDVTEKRLAEEQLKQLAHYDVLTRLPNRALFYDRMRQALAQARRNLWTVGVMFIDLDRFKNVNDTLGHVMGDRLLQQVSGRLAGSVRADDTVGRLGGDEFAIVLSNLSSGQDASLVAQKIMAGFEQPFDLGGSEIYVTASIGITLYPEDSTDQDTLIKNADAAMYRAKQAGRNAYHFYTSEMDAKALETLGLESSLRRALERKEFLLHYQPKIGLDTGAITGFEALLRWQHGDSTVAPAEFIPILEETGLIVPVGEWVLKSVCGQLRQWERDGVVARPVAVNLSARQFQRKNLATMVGEVLQEAGVDPGLIELELTETLLMSEAEEAVETLRQLKSLGVRLAVDDFGTGYSSLAYLKRFPIDALKIDRSFIRDAVSDPDDAAIACTIISLAHSLKLKVVAEGVETEGQYCFLKANGCDEMQGYYFARPLPVEECTRALTEGLRLHNPPVGTVPDAPVLLLVDDDEDDLLQLQQALSAEPLHILTAKGARAGFELLARHGADIVISDHHMPEMTGIEFLTGVRKLYPNTVRVLASSDDDVPTLTRATNRAGIHRYLSKAWGPERLRAEVREALDARPEAPSGGDQPAALGAVAK